jgi:hypothetical protein
MEERKHLLIKEIHIKIHPEVSENYGQILVLKKEKKMKQNKIIRKFK